MMALVEVVGIVMRVNKEFRVGYVIWISSEGKRK